MTCHILGLPVEILQQIGNIGRLETASLRLVCKAFDAAYLDQFCRDYLSDIHCFLLDPERLRKLKDITSKPYLAKRMPRVTLTLDPLENSDMDEISTVASNREPETVQVFELDHETQQFRDSMYRRRDIFEHCCVNECDLDLMIAVIDDLKKAQCPNLSLNLDERQRYTGTTQHAQVSSIFNTVMWTKCKLTGLQLGNLRDLRAGFDVAAFHKDLKTFCLWSCEDDIESLVKRAWAGEDQLMKLILRDANELETLSISGVGHGSRHYNGISLDLRQVSYIHFMKMTLNANKFSALQDIDLFGVDIDVEDLRTVLHNCSKTLRVARLEYLLLAGDSGAWVQILKLLLEECCNLNWLKLSMLSEESELVVDTTPHVSHAKLYQAVETTQYTAEVSWDGRQEVVEGLRLNIERGIKWYKDCIKKGRFPSQVLARMLI
ncbi:hypothetical protein CLAFUW4_06609 [Fulvia fulva]|uniref:F-box domain-containing protein n=1 Tax=Passalora fulva TaxID=5499 RepID=A0A9Q8UR74_PASFU|nr:uncharacterized protein CLAFUR5_06754 [Fulvia fulva]KAK4622092.1 hypothetical protein CLAFUR4_06617 [Fulvia fulva]KAK4622833.1 hypothetical protein CLAFUR0_06611 [Fulvia fulva]UJO19463.1 hypothetical protein CLAFUR5_06754 [Fulvia fulva]WPV16446.1 hypothetical protein CLAFUW4_06609 [Fulvia fulva]WPV31013.1 hypothetical protein CLAFUW7_06608 [Fulvia fulva]